MYLLWLFGGSVVPLAIMVFFVDFRYEVPCWRGEGDNIDLVEDPWRDSRGKCQFVEHCDINKSRDLVEILEKVKNHLSWIARHVGPNSATKKPSGLWSAVPDHPINIGALVVGGGWDWGHSKAHTLTGLAQFTVCVELFEAEIILWSSTVISERTLWIEVYDLTSITF